MQERHKLRWLALRKRNGNICTLRLEGAIKSTFRHLSIAHFKVNNWITGKPAQQKY
jgi:hypothetical protein